jgi:hypothetical protein
MRCRWWFVGAGILLAVAVGFQQAEPLDKLHEFGKVGSGGWWVDGKLHGRRFVAKDSSPIHFVNALALLQKCPSVNRVAVPKSPELGRVLARLADIDHIVAIELFDKDVTDEDLSGLAGMKQLGFLDLSRNPKVTDAGIAALAGLENLRYLNLTNTRVTGTGLKDRADMASLYQLNLTGCPVTDESLAPIPRFPKLEELLLAGTEVTDTGLMGLVGWHSLRRVLWSDRMTVEGQHAFNAAFLAARRKAREKGVPMDPRDIPPIFFNGPREPR